MIYLILYLLVAALVTGGFYLLTNLHEGFAPPMVAYAVVVGLCWPLFLIGYVFIMIWSKFHN